MTRKSKVISVISSLCFFVAILLGIIFLTCFNHSFYQYEYAKNNQAEVIGMSNDDLMNATDTLLDYLEDKRDDIVVEADVNGSVREVFNERETLHMIDVKALCQHAKFCGGILFFIGCILSFILYHQEKNQFFSCSLYGMKTALLLMGIFVGFLAIYAIADFYDFWMNFHYLFFDNDLFILDPNTSIMINMFPESFFFDLVILIMVVYSIVIVTCYNALKRMARKEVI